MEIILAKSAGFCFGVHRAVDMAFKTEEDKKTYTLGHIIHNETVTRKLKQKGIESVEALDNIPMEKVIIRAHGVPEAVYKEAESKNIEVLDATCPYVTKIHRLVSRYEKEGYSIIVIGDAKHPEIIGINGWTKEGCIIYKNKEDVDFTELDLNKKYLIVSQTTYKKEVVDGIVKLLEEAGYDVKFINTICNATSERQEEAKEISKEVDAMIVIGSSFSSNTQKLFEICKSYCQDTYCIEEAKDLNAEWFKSKNKVGVTAGASTPKDVIEEVLEVLKGMDAQ